MICILYYRLPQWWPSVVSVTACSVKWRVFEAAHMNAAFQCGADHCTPRLSMMHVIARPTELISIVNSVKMVYMSLAWLPSCKEGKSLCILFTLLVLYILYIMAPLNCYFFSSFFYIFKYFLKLVFHKSQNEKYLLTIYMILNNKIRPVSTKVSSSGKSNVPN